MVAAEREFLEVAWSLVCEAEEQSQQRDGRGHWARPRLGCWASLAQEQDCADGPDEGPIGDSLALLAEAQQDWSLGRTNDVVD